MRLQLGDKTSQVRQRGFPEKVERGQRQFSVRGAIKPRLPELNGTAGKRGKNEKETEEELGEKQIDDIGRVTILCVV